MLILACRLRGLSDLCNLPHRLTLALRWSVYEPARRQTFKEGSHFLHVLFSAKFNDENIIATCAFHDRLEDQSASLAVPLNTALDAVLASAAVSVEAL